MNDQGSFIALLLETSSKAYAAGAVLRVREAGPEAAGWVERWGFSDLVQDTQVRLQYLAEALACGRPEVLDLDVDWLAATYASRGMPAGFLKTTLGCLRDELLESLPPDAGALAAEYLQRSLDRLEQPTEPPTGLLSGDAPFASLARDFLEAVLEGNRGRAEGLILEALDTGASVGELHTHVVTKVQMELGRRWQIGESHVGEEHFSSRIVEDVLAQLRGRMPRAPENHKCVLLASVSGNLHDIGPRLVADHFEMNGWRTIFLGANMPSADLVHAARDFEPQLVALSVGQATNLRSAADTIQALRSELPNLVILVGGAPFAAVDGLWKDLGADGFAANAADAVELGQRLLSAG